MAYLPRDRAFSASFISLSSSTISSVEKVLAVLYIVLPFKNLNSSSDFFLIFFQSKILKNSYLTI